MDYKKLARLVERAKQGEEEAFAQLYNEFSKSVYYIGLRMTKNAQDADDVVQETMMDLHKAINSINNVQTLAPYINRIATHQCIDLMRKNKTVLMEDEKDAALENKIEENVDFIPEEFAQRKEQREYIISLIQELNESQRSVVMLYYYNELPIKQIAGFLGMDETAVKMRLSRARAALKEKLETGMLKGLVMSVMPTSVLTQILQMDANAVFTAEVSARNWQSLASKLGYAPEIIAATTVVATASTVASTTAASTVATATATATTVAASTSASTTSIISVVIATTVVATGITGGVLFYQTDTGQLPAPQESIAAPIAYFQENDVISDILAGIDISDGGEQESDTSGAPTMETPMDGAGATTPAETSELPDEASGIEGEASFTVRNRELSYPAGTSVSQEQLLTDAGVSATDGAGNELAVKIEYFELVDWNKPYRYAVYIKAIDDDGSELAQVVISILII